MKNSKKNTKRTMTKKKDLRSEAYIGKKVPGTMLTPISLFARIKVPYGTEGKSTWHAIWWYKCDCGTVISKKRHNVGKSERQAKSCGCLRKKKAKEISQLPQVAKNRFTKDNKTGNKRQIGAKIGHTSPRTGSICIYKYPNQGSSSPRKYVSVEEFHDILAGFKVVNWD